MSHAPKPAAAPQTPPPASTFPIDLNQVSLQQALRDFEIANARVLDLTQRLIASEKARKELESELNRMKLNQQPPSATVTALELAAKALSKVARRLSK